MTTPESDFIGDLPLVADVVAPEQWSANLLATSFDLLQRGIRLLRSTDGGLIVLGHAELRDLAAHPAVGNAPVEFLTGRSDERYRRASGGSDCPVSVEASIHFLGNQVFTMNPPVHTLLRRRLVRPLMPRPVRALAGRAVDVAEEVLAELATQTDGFELGPEFSARYVTRFWTRQLGIPVEHAARIQHLMEEMNLQFLFDPTAAEITRGRTATAEYMALVESEIEQAWSRGPGELLTQLAEGLDTVELNGSPTDYRASVASNFFDAFHTVGVAVTNSVYELFTRPKQLQMVRDDDTLVAQAFAEGIRLAPPLMLTTRVALEDFDYHRMQIPEGTPLHMIWAAGNYDATAFPNPDTYDLSRPPRFGMTFGGGAHLCPGRNAAQMLSETALRVLTRPDVNLRFVSAQHEWVPGSGIRHLRSLRAVVQLAPR